MWSLHAPSLPPALMSLCAPGQHNPPRPYHLYFLCTQSHKIAGLHIFKAHYVYFIMAHTKPSCQSLSYGFHSVVYMTVQMQLSGIFHTEFGQPNSIIMCSNISSWEMLIATFIHCVLAKMPPPSPPIMTGRNDIYC